MSADPTSPTDHAPDAGRREPVIGDFGGLRFRKPMRLPQSGRWPRWTWWLAAVPVVLVVAMVLLREPLGNRLWPANRVQQLSEAAEQALARGHLTAADGSGARELYEAAVAIDPDRPEPRAGLGRVADAALAQAAEATAQSRFADAHAALRLARGLSVPRERADAVANRLREQEAAHAGLDGLLASAEQARLGGRLDGGDDTALPLYARVLDLQPNRADALRGREDALSALLERARADLRDGEIAAAATAIAAARRYDPGHVDLPDTQARFTEELDAVRRRAEASLEAGRLEAAVDAWQGLLVHDPADAGALKGLQQASEAYAARAQRIASDFRFAEADAALRQAQALAPDADAVVAARGRVEQARRRQAQLQAPVAGGARGQRVPELLRQAEAAETRGDLLTPPGDSAFDKLRAAQALAPRDARVQRAVARLLPAARECFERGLSANDLARARSCLDARDALGDDASAVAQGRRRLAQRWLAIGDERLASGQLAPAQMALATARSLDPSTPGIAEFDQRLRTASGDR